jgi:hypothetical protein
MPLLTLDSKKVTNPSGSTIHSAAPTSSPADIAGAMLAPDAACVRNCSASNPVHEVQCMHTAVAGHESSQSSAFGNLLSMYA